MPAPIEFSMEGEQINNLSLSCINNFQCQANRWIIA
jgi:hypothetical protein